MRTICSICLEEVGKGPLIAINGCGHVFDLECIKECLQTTLKCPLCRKSTHGQSCTRIYLTTESDDNPSECAELKRSLTTSKIVITDFQEQLALSKNKLIVANRDYNEKKRSLEATSKELTEIRAVYHEEIRQKTEYLDKISNLTSSNEKLVNELTDLATKNGSLEKDLRIQREKNTQASRKRNYEKDYFNLKKTFDDFVSKQEILESKFIDLTITGQPDQNEVKTHIQNLENRLIESKAKQDKLHADIKRISKKNQTIQHEKQKLIAEKQNIISDKSRIIIEKESLKEKLTETNQDASKLKEFKKNWVNESRTLQENLKATKETVSKLQDYKRNWIAENRALHDNIKSLKENTKTLLDNQKKIILEKQALQNKLAATLRDNRIAHLNRTLTERNVVYDAYDGY